MVWQSATFGPVQRAHAHVTWIGWSPLHVAPTLSSCCPTCGGPLTNGSDNTRGGAAALAAPASASITPSAIPIAPVIRPQSTHRLLSTRTPLILLPPPR